MNLNELLLGKDINPKHVLVLRHRPKEPELNKRLPWLAAEKPNVFNAYQQTQEGKLEAAMEAMKGTGYVASFIGQEPGKALFVGLYSIAASKPLTYEEFWQVPEYIEMKPFGMKGWNTKEAGRPTVLWFDLVLSDFYAQWKGKLIVKWPPPERSWWRRAHRNENEMPVLAVLEDSALDGMPEWNAINFTWEDLKILPRRFRSMLSQLPAIYYIFDTSDCKGYVGSAYGKSNLLGRWQNYAASGHGENQLLRKRDPKSFRFTILQPLPLGVADAEVFRLESSWKERLHTRAPNGLNDN